MTRSGFPEAVGVTIKPEEPRGKPLCRVTLLGALRVFRLRDGDGEAAFYEAADGEADALQFRTHKAALLFARLVLYPHRAHGRDELADWLWPDLPADKARVHLSQTLHQMKEPFVRFKSDGKRSEPLFIGDHQTVRARAGTFLTDVAAFEKRTREAERTRNASPVERAAHWKAAIESYGGDLLPGFYDDWIERERQRLRACFDAAQAQYSEAERSTRRMQTEGTAAASTNRAVDAAGVQPSPRTISFPLTLTRFFGREAERADLCARLTHADFPARLITVVGAGGMGKTRLAVQAAQQIGEAFAFAAFISLADLSDPDLIPAALLQSLAPKTSEAPKNADETLARVVDFLLRIDGGNGRVLLVLDNLEQFGDACAPIIAHLLTHVPSLTVLATSRQPIGVSGEQELWLGPLGLPMGAAGAALPPDVQLFVDRARLVRLSFALTPHNEPSVRALCSLLEGVPLALELAAAWIRTLSSAQIIERLCHRFDLLQRRGAAHSDLPKRHQSLHAAIAWSYDLLPPNLQMFWARLSVFRGGWTAEAARAVTGINDVAEPLLLLAERSLILVDEDEETGAARYRMLESLREFAQEQAEAQGQDFENDVRLRHAQHFSRLSREASAMTKDGRGMRPALNLLGLERDNLRAIFAALQERADRSATQRKASPSALFVQAAIESILCSIWLWSGRESHSYLSSAEAALGILPDEMGRPLWASVLALQGRAASLAGDYAIAEQKFCASLTVWTALGNVAEAMAVKNYRAAQAAFLGNVNQAHALFAEILRFAQKNNKLRLESAMLNNLATIGPDLEQRRAWIERAVYLDRTHWPSSTNHACSLNSLGSIALMQNDIETARQCFEQAHDIAVTDGFSGMIGVAKYGLANFYYEAGESLDRAAQLLGDARVHWQTSGEHPRLAGTLRLQFDVSLKRSDFAAALRFAQEYVTINRDARLMDESLLCAAQADLMKQLREAGCLMQERSL